MENRFVDDAISKPRSMRRRNEFRPPARAKSTRVSRQSSRFARSFTADQRALVILIENGGIDLGIPELVDKLLGALPGANLLAESTRQQLIVFIRDTIRGLTDSLLESAELAVNRYAAAAPEHFGSVTVLRNGTATYDDLKNRLFSLSKEGKLVDLMILTHGSDNEIAVNGGITGEKIRHMRAEFGKPLSIRSVYMMNCVGSSLNQAWLDAGAKVSSGSIRNNYLPEPTTFFFWQNWKQGQNFETAVTSAYRRTINLMNEAIRGFVRQLPIPGADLVASQIDVEAMDFVRDSAPVIQGQRSVTVDSDDLSFAQSVTSALATTVLPVSLLQSLSRSASPAQRTPFARGASLLPGYSAPFYDTGEHVFPGENLYPDQLLVGKAPGVLFSYGHLIAMADLFDSPRQLMDESASTLQNIKRLIEQSMAYYKHGKSSAHPDVSNKAWKDATGGRYMKLAEDNYDHFAPNVLFRNEAFARNATRHGNHKSKWEYYHEQAIKEAQRMGLDPANANRSYIPVWPLIVNAFGDHFLTDAFAAGHVVNKEAVIAYFRSRFYSGQNLTSEGNAFFEKVAVKAWRDKVAELFPKLETVEPHDAWWNIMKWNPNITNADRFASVLKGVAQQKPDAVANVAVKAIHDELNRDGIDVVNDAGSPAWKLTGDGHLTPATLAVMRQAVAQSVANINDPSIFASNIAFGNYFAKVWAYVPKLTPASEAKVKQLVLTNISPSSAWLIGKAADLIVSEVENLIEALTDPSNRALQPA